jgi:hypothetical protein
MCTYEQIRWGLGSLDNLIKWDQENLPQREPQREAYVACMLGEVDISEQDYARKYLSVCNRYHGQLQQYLTDLSYSGLLDTLGGRKIALMLMEYPGQALEWRFDTHQVPMYNTFTQKIMREIMSSDVWRPEDANELIRQVLATPRRDSDLLTFKLLM